jgi:diguanylate cyclase (GGDEF)-like protein
MSNFTKPRVPRRRQKVLIVDDDPDTRELLRRICLDLAADVDLAEDLQGALERVGQGAPDLVLLDMVLPDGGAVELLESFRGNRALEQVPVIVVSARHDVRSKVDALGAGAHDYLVKPFDLQEMLARIDAQLRVRRRWDELERRNLELRVANERLEELASTDELTGLQNARAFHERLQEEFLRAQRYETPLALVMTDLDGFKDVNDQHGHGAGDRIIAQVAQRLRAQARATDIVSRYGGDEFAFLLPHTDVHEAEKFAWRLCTKIDTAPLRLPMGGVVPIALSCGVAAWPTTEEVGVARELFLRADQALYDAKRGGGGGVVVAGRSPSSPAGEEPEPDASPDANQELRPGPRPPRGAEAS